MKRNIRHICYIILIGVVNFSCIERYYLHGSEDNFTSKIVIQGTLKDDGGEQEIVISNSAVPEFPAFHGETGCRVEVVDDNGNLYEFLPSAANKGHYLCTIEKEKMVIGTQYKLFVTTSDNREYQSEWEELLPCPEVERVYYELDSKPTSDKGINEEGVQFYLDFTADDSYGDFFRWQLEETYEYHSSWAITRYLDYTGYHQEETDSSYYVCYQTQNVGDIFALSTKGFVKNQYKGYKLHFVNDHTQRLLYQYSLLVKQYSISESAYYFWENLRKNNQESANLFDSQPAIVHGNMSNVKDSMEMVFGYFGVSSVREKRIQIVDVPELSFEEVPYCTPVPLEAGVPIPTKPRPLYFTLTKDSHFNLVWGFAPSECFICTMLGGTIEKPSYWIEE